MNIDNKVFKKIKKPVEGTIQGNVFVIQRIQSGVLYLKDEDDNEFEVEVPPNLIVFMTMAEATGLSGPAEFCQLPNGNCSIDWLDDNSSPLMKDDFEVSVENEPWRPLDLEKDFQKALKGKGVVIRKK